MARNKVLIVDDHPLIHFAVSQLLQPKGFTIVGQAETGIEGIQLAEILQPDIVVLDIGIPKLNGLSVIKHLKAIHRPPQIVIFTAEVSDYYATLCISLGATGYVRKSSGLDTLVQAICSAQRGEYYFPTLTQRHAEPVFTHKPFQLLSAAELAVLDLLLAGKRNIEISLLLNRSQKTISTHKMNIFHKLNIRSMADLASISSLGF